jgi:hypothetical protein
MFCEKSSVSVSVFASVSAKHFPQNEFYIKMFYKINRYILHTHYTNVTGILHFVNNEARSVLRGVFTRKDTALDVMNKEKIFV